jgi:hypothetical protein
MGAMWNPMYGPCGTVAYADSTNMCQCSIHPHLPAMCIPHHMPLYLPLYLPCKHHTDVPCVTLEMVTHVTTFLAHLFVHVSAKCNLPHQQYGCTTCIVKCQMALYKLYDHHFFFLFGQMNRTPYLENTISI